MDSQLPKCLSCPICYEVYDEQTHLPIIIPCGNGHTICATCIVNTWGEDGKFKCPFDKVELYYYNGIVNELAKNRVVLDALEELKRENCSKHPSRKLDLICNTCQVPVCSACQLRGDHAEHDIILLEEFEEEVEKGWKRIKKYFSDIEEIFEKIITIVNQRQTVLHDMINQKFHQYAEKLKNSRDFMKKQIELHFSKMKEEIHSNVLNQGSETKQILAWKTKVKEITKKNTRKKSVDNDFEVIKQNKIASTLAIESWLEEKKQNIQKLEKRLEEMWIEFEKEFEANIHGSKELEDKYDTFLDNIQNEIGLECRSPGLKEPSPQEEVLEGTTNEEREDSGSSTLLQRRSRPRNITLDKTRSFRLDVKATRSQDVKNYTQFLQENRANGVFRGLTRLNFGCERLKGNEAREMIETLEEFQDLTHLQIQFGWCKSVTDDTVNLLCEILKTLNNLTFLEIFLPGCDNISEKSLTAIGNILPTLPLLTHLHFDFGMCPKVNDDGLVSLSEKISCLRNLVEVWMSFTGCAKISDYGIKQLGINLSKVSTLKGLQLSFTLCKKISDHGVQGLTYYLNKLDNLDQLQVRFIGCTQITTKGQNSLKEFIFRKKETVAI